MGPELGKSRSTATAVASTPHGAGAHADHEPTASRGAERRTALDEASGARCGTRATGVVQVSALGEPATARSAGVTGSTDADHCRVDRGHRAGSKKVPGGTALADASRSRCPDRVGVRTDHRASGAVSVWQADRELSGTGAVGRFEWAAAPTGTHHETRKLAVAVSAGRSGASDGAEPPRMAE